MKIFTAALAILLALNTAAHAQYGVVDTHPSATIAIVDPQSGQEVFTQRDTAILFKDALIDLVNHTTLVQTFYRHVLGHLGYVITQTDPSNGNEYQVQQTSKVFGATAVVYTFIYNVDQNKLFYMDAQNGNVLEAQWISQNNLPNLDRCQQFGWFNNLSNGPQNNAPPVADNYQPVDNEVTTTTAPPPLPTYEQPECPQDGYLWQPGYWAYSTEYRDYYWVPGVWVAPPSEELLWTPAYWALEGLVFVYHAGYWSGNVGYYGGIDYGYGYAGHGYYGGEWRDGRFRYNTAVVRVGNDVHNTYINKTVIVVEPARNNSSFNGRGGVVAHPIASEEQVMHQPHVNPTNDQLKNQWIARGDKNQFASNNNGQKPMNLAHDKVPVQTSNINPNMHSPALPANNANPAAGAWRGRPVSASPLNQRPVSNSPAGTGTQAPATNSVPVSTYQPAANGAPANTNQQTRVSGNTTGANGAATQPVKYSGHSIPIPAGSGTSAQPNNSRGAMPSQNNNGGATNSRNATPAVIKQQPKAQDKTPPPAKEKRGKKDN